MDSQERQAKPNPRPAVNRRRNSLPHMSGPLLDSCEFDDALRKSSRLLKEADEQRQRKQRIPKDSPGGGNSQRMKRILKQPRLGTLKQRKKLLDKKCREAGVRTPMALAAKKAA